MIRVIGLLWADVVSVLTFAQAAGLLLVFFRHLNASTVEAMRCLKKYRCLRLGSQAGGLPDVGFYT